MNWKQMKRNIKNKLRKETKEEKMLELRTQITTLSDELEAHIDDELSKIRQSREKGIENSRAKTRLENAYYTRLLLDQARDELKDIKTDEGLNKIINKTGFLLARLNLKADFSPKIGSGFFNWQAGTLNERMVKKIETEIRPGVDETAELPNIIDRLVKGEHLSKCIDDDRLLIQNNGILDSSLDEYENDYRKILNEMRNEM